jgi:hypothetical protein
MKSFLTNISSSDKEIVESLQAIIIKKDSLVSERVGKLMNIEGAFIYEQEGIFKYGLAKTSKHFTFHSMVMYAFPEIMDLSKKSFIGKGIKFQKGCINFSNISSISIQAFQDVLELSSKKNFELVINHYKK